MCMYNFMLIILFVLLVLLCFVILSCFFVYFKEIWKFDILIISIGNIVKKLILFCNLLLIFIIYFLLL